MSGFFGEGGMFPNDGFENIKNLSPPLKADPLSERDQIGEDVSWGTGFMLSEQETEEIMDKLKPRSIRQIIDSAIDS